MSSKLDDNNLKLQRCEWAGDDPIYVKYHDEEWGRPVGLPSKPQDDRTQFEFLMLESAQAGLSWITILKRREGYRRVFMDFDVEKVAKFTEADIQKALLDVGIIRNKLKVRAAVKNAKVFIEIQQEFGSFSDYIWGFVDNEPLISGWKAMSEVPATTKLSDKVSKDLKSRGMSFVGSTIVYAHLQATGIVNDHTTDCFRYSEV